MSSPEFAQENETRTFADYYPGPEDWIALQGGKPRVFRNPDRPESRWIVLHVYDEHDDPDHRFVNGSIVDTLPPGDTFSLSRFEITRRNFEGEIITRDIRVPSFMVNTLHGGPCATRSAATSGNTSGGYDRVWDQAYYESFLNQLRARGMQEMRFGLSRGGFKLEPLTEIRLARPLAQPGRQQS